MAKCKFCNQKISDEVTDCTGNRVVYFYNLSIELPSIPYENEDGKPCRDCGVSPSCYHHPGCDQEECPHCHGQYISCDCDSSHERIVS